LIRILTQKRLAKNRVLEDNTMLHTKKKLIKKPNSSVLN
jgi:hypothetical protein